MKNCCLWSPQKVIFTKFVFLHLFPLKFLFEMTMEISQTSLENSDTDIRQEAVWFRMWGDIVLLCEDLGKLKAFFDSSNNDLAAFWMGFCVFKAQNVAGLGWFFGVESCVERIIFVVRLFTFHWFVVCRMKCCRVYKRINWNHRYHLTTSNSRASRREGSE